VFCEGVQHRLRFCLDHIDCVKMAAFQFYLQSGKQRNVGWVGYVSHVVFGQKFPGDKRKCEMVCCRVATASSSVAKVWGEVFANFHVVTINCYSSIWNWLFGLPGQIICEQSRCCQRKWWACSWLCSSPVSPFQSALNQACHSNTCVWCVLSSPHASLFIVRVSVTFPRDLHKI
jgi:hypothetical protein